MFAAGIEFISEDGRSGAGVRFRERKLEYTSNVRIDHGSRAGMMRMRYAGEDFQCLIDLDAVDDYHRTNFHTDDEFITAISEVLHIVLAAAERFAPTHIRDGKLIITYSMLQAG
jgi:hypothetical protein